jgi:hypothetical protein
LTKLGTYLVLKRIWNLIDFQGHRSKAPVYSTNKTGHHEITEILLKVALNTINQTKPIKANTSVLHFIAYVASKWIMIFFHS